MREKIKFTKKKFGVCLILILSSVLNFANIGIEGYANTYYSAGVKSMMMNLKNFFFVSSDPSGFVTIDKPPIGFWLQTLSAKIFGFSGWSVILPQAVAGVISVWLIYYLVNRSFGSLAGLVSALCLAVTPIFVATSRNNTIDNLLVLSSLLACWAISLAAEKGKFKYLILSLAIVGIGFNIKMVEAYMVAPAIFITYFFSSALYYKIKIEHLIIGSVILLVVSLSWAIIVDLVPANDRPFIGSSTNNSVMELIIGHNGIERLGIGGRNANKGDSEQDVLKNQTNMLKSKLPTHQSVGGQYEMENNSKTGITKLFYYNNLSDQISWFLPLALIGFIASAIEENFKFPFDNKRKLSLLLWSMWLLTEFVYFSFSKNVTHTYYLTTMAPSIAALTGIGLAAMWKFYKEEGWEKWILPSAFITNGLTEIFILYYNYNYVKSNGYKIIIIITGILCIVASTAMVIDNTIKRRNSFYAENTSVRKSNVILASIAFIGILTAPMVWSFTTIFYPMNASSPAAGLDLEFNMQSKNFSNSRNLKLIQFLEKNNKNEKYFIAVPSAMTYASDLILKTGKPVITLGGFGGSDKIITLNQFKQLVIKGAVRYVLVSDVGRRGVGPMESNANNDIMSWVKINGKLVADSEWKDSTTSNILNNNKNLGGFSGETNSSKLYDLADKIKYLSVN